MCGFWTTIQQKGPRLRGWRKHSMSMREGRCFRTENLTANSGRRCIDCLGRRRQPPHRSCRLNHQLTPRAEEGTLNARADQEMSCWPVFNTLASSNNSFFSPSLALSQVASSFPLPPFLYTFGWLRYRSCPQSSPTQQYLQLILSSIAASWAGSITTLQRSSSIHILACTEARPP